MNEHKKPVIYSRYKAGGQGKIIPQEKMTAVGNSPIYAKTNVEFFPRFNNFPSGNLFVQEKHNRISFNTEYL